MYVPVSKYFARLLFVAASAAALFGAPKLRLSTAAIGPFSIAQGQSGPNQTVDAFNAGDGDLSLSASSSASWLNVSIGDPRSCGQGRCNAVQLVLQTASLPRGVATAFVTVSDPNANDAPQTISVTVQMGGGVPDKMQFYLPPDGSQVRQSFQTSTSFNLSGSVGGGPRLTVLGGGGGTFRTVNSYDVIASAPAGTSEGDYTGALLISGSPLSADNRSVPVAVRVTSKGIAAPSSASVEFRTAAGFAAQQKTMAINNAGIGTLTISGFTTSMTGDGNWLSAAQGFDPNQINVTVTPDGLAKGSYQGQITITSDAVNDTVQVPVTLEVADAGPPAISYGRVVTTIGGEPGVFALGDLITLYGEMFTAGIAEASPGSPWSSTLATSAIFLNDQQVPLSIASYGQIDFQIPFDAATGEAVLRVERDGVRGNTVDIVIVRDRARLFSAVSGAGVTVSTIGGGPLSPVKAGDTINLVGAGFGPPTSYVPPGTSAPDGATIDPAPTVRIGGSIFNQAPAIQPSFAGLIPGTIGLYQLTVTIPLNTSRGPSIGVTVQGARDPILLNIQ